MHKVIVLTAFIHVMNARSIFDRNDCGEVLVAETKCMHISVFQETRGLGRGVRTLWCSDCRTGNTNNVVSQTNQVDSSL